MRPGVLEQVAIAISTDPQDIGSAFFIGMKAAIGAALGVACAPSTIGTRIDVGEGKHSQRRDEKNDSSHESLLNTDSKQLRFPYHRTCPKYVMRVTLYPIPLKVSGAQTDRPELAKLLKCLGRGEVLMVTRLDRLARSRVTEMDLRDLRDGRASARQLGRWPTFLMRDIEEVEAKAAELRGEQRRAKLT